MLQRKPGTIRLWMAAAGAVLFVVCGGIYGIVGRGNPEGGWMAAAALGFWLAVLMGGYGAWARYKWRRRAALAALHYEARRQTLAGLREKGAQHLGGTRR